jgi:tetratricopeptide (TPR) repeat protein
VRSAYRRLVRLYHPDTAGTDTASLRAFHRVTEAYRALIDVANGASSAAASIAPPSREEIAGMRRMTLSTLMLNRLALSYIDDDRTDDAARILDRLIDAGLTPPRRRRRPLRTDFRINPTKPENAAVPLPETRVNRAYLSFLSDRADHAVEHLLRARDLDEDDLSIAYNLSLMYRMNGRFLDAARITNEMAWGWEERLAFLRELDGLVSFFDRRKDVVGHLKRVVAGKHRRVADGGEDGYIIRLLTDGNPTGSAPG